MSTRRYLVIENKIEIEPNAFMLMGASTKRGVAGKIGMYGTGLSYSVAALLSRGIGVVITSGDTTYKFSTESTTLRGQEFSQVVVRNGHKKSLLGFTTELGLNWTAEMGIRELVSNAYDEELPRIYTTSSISSAEGYTRVHLTWTEDVREFYSKLDELFLFNRTPLEVIGRNRIFEKRGEGTRVYRRGVRVFYSPTLESAFDYEIDSLQPQEDRTCDLWNIRYHLSYVLDSLPILRKRQVMKAIERNSKSLEAESSVECHLFSPDWQAVFEDRVVVTSEVNGHLFEELRPFNPAVLPEQWVRTLAVLNCKQAVDVLDTTRLKGYQIVENADLPGVDMAILDQSVSFLEQIGLPIECPLQVFKSSVPDAPLGEFHRKEDKILLNLLTFSMGKRTVIEVLIEEVVHRRSGASDKSRAFQTALIRELTDVAVKFTGAVL